ncbi:BrnA antitoxin family protein [Propionivibrio sp.]|uniref:BrnA antitoxin family protein n=1 Tax=Propionivibrio sp. TaxID=2212460 RepID=UPI003BEFB0CF
MKATYDFNAGKRGAVIPSSGKTRITIHVDNDVLESFRAKAALEGKGYQTLINEALRQLVESNTTPVTLENLRQVIREELHAA